MGTKKTTAAQQTEQNEELNLTLEPEKEADAVPNPNLEQILAEQAEKIRQLEAKLAGAQKQVARHRQTDAEIVKQAAEDAAKEGKDPWTVLVSVQVPRRPATEEQYYWIMVNGRSVQIPADNKIQELKLPFAEVLYNQLASEQRTKEYIDSIEVYDPVTNPKPDAKMMG